MPHTKKAEIRARFSQLPAARVTLRFCHDSRFTVESRDRLPSFFDALTMEFGTTLALRVTLLFALLPCDPLVSLEKTGVVISSSRIACALGRRPNEVYCRGPNGLVILVAGDSVKRLQAGPKGALLIFDRSARSLTVEPDVLRHQFLCFLGPPQTCVGPNGDLPVRPEPGVFRDLLREVTESSQNE